MRRRRRCAASTMGAGVRKSPPTSIWMMSRPAAELLCPVRDLHHGRVDMSASGEADGAFLCSLGKNKRQRRCSASFCEAVNRRKGASRSCRFRRRRGRCSNSSRFSVSCFGSFAQLVEPFLVAGQFGLPGFGIDLGQRLEFGLGDVEAGPVDVFVRGIQPARFPWRDTAADAVDDPLRGRACSRRSPAT